MPTSMSLWSAIGKKQRFQTEPNEAPLTGWYNGDFNYDGFINGSDYTLMDNAFNTQGSQFTSEIAGPDVTVAAQIAGVSAVPEPAITGFLPGCVIALLGRRRRIAIKKSSCGSDF